MAGESGEKQEFLEHVLHHVQDGYYFEFPEFLGGKLAMPFLAGWQPTKFMVLQVIAGCLTLLVFALLARKIRSGQPLKGGFWNFWEMLAVYIRDEVVRPTIGDPDHDDHGADGHDHGIGHEEDIPNPAYAATHESIVGAHPADRFLPLIWTFFFYILFCNLLGMIPGLGSATGNINVTAPLALCAFGASVYYGVKKMGGIGFLKNLAPELNGLGAMGYVLIPLLYVIEGVGFLIKHCVLAIRLFANMYGGHMVLAVLLTFIWQVAGTGTLAYVVTPASVAAQAAVSLLELFVAFLQAYVFAFLATLFIATAVHHH